MQLANIIIDSMLWMIYRYQHFYRETRETDVESYDVGSNNHERQYVLLRIITPMYRSQGT